MTNKTFDKQVAIVTGAGQGIGYEIATQLSLCGASVILNDLDGELANKAAENITAAGGICIAVPGDSSNVSFINRMVNTAVEKFGSITLAVANAGLSLYGNFFEYPEADFDRVTKVNLGGSFYLAQAVANQIIKQKGNGSILFVSSVVGHQALRDLAAYAVTKAGLEMLAKNLVVELSPYNISVNAVAPGATATERTLTYEDYIGAWSSITPMGRPATVSDVANAALFFLSPASRHITGQSLIIDGGWTSVSPSPPNK